MLNHYSPLTSTRGFDSLHPLQLLNHKIIHEHNLNNLNELPVVDGDAGLIGAVQRNKTTSGILMQLVADR